MNTHLDEDQILAYVTHSLSVPMQEQVQAHLDHCATCQESVDEWRTIAQAVHLVAQQQALTLPPLVAEEPNLNHQPKERIDTMTVLALPRQNRNLYSAALTAIIALILTLVATMLLMNNTDDESPLASALVTPAPTQQFVEIVVAVRDIQQGAVITAEDLRLQTWPLETVPFNAIASIDDVVGKPALMTILAGQPLLTSMILDELTQLGPVPSASDSLTLFDLIISHDRLSNFGRVVGVDDEYRAILQSGEPVLVLAPSDEAMGEMGATILDALALNEGLRKHFLRSHILRGGNNADVYQHVNMTVLSVQTTDYGGILLITACTVPLDGYPCEGTSTQTNGAGALSSFHQTILPEDRFTNSSLISDLQPGDVISINLRLCDLYGESPCQNRETFPFIPQARVIEGDQKTVLLTPFEFSLFNYLLTVGVVTPTIQFELVVRDHVDVPPIIPAGTVAVALPLDDTVLSIVYGAGDHVNVYATLCFFDIDEEFQQLLPYDADDCQLVTQKIVDDAVVVRMGSPEDTSASVVTLAVSPQDALILTWAVEAKILLNFALTTSQIYDVGESNVVIGFIGTDIDGIQMDLNPDDILEQDYAINGEQRIPYTIVRLPESQAVEIINTLVLKQQGRTAQTTQPIMQGIISAIESVNIREVPGINSAAIASLPPGTPVEIIGQSKDGSWFYIRTDEDVYGWISPELILIQYAPQGTMLPTACTFHIIQEAETLLGIAQMYDVTGDELLTANNLSEGSAISTGQLLVIPKCPSVPAITVTPTISHAQIEIAEVIGAGNPAQEATVIRNNGATIDISGWTIQDADGNVFTFPDNQRLFTDASVTVYTRPGEDTPIEFFWGLDEAVFEAGEQVELKNADGRVIASYKIGQ